MFSFPPTLITASLNSPSLWQYKFKMRHMSRFALNNSLKVMSHLDQFEYFYGVFFFYFGAWQNTVLINFHYIKKAWTRYSSKIPLVVHILTVYCTFFCLLAICTIFLFTVYCLPFAMYCILCIMWMVEGWVALSIVVCCDLLLFILALVMHLGPYETKFRSAVWMNDNWAWVDLT